ncbi:hypothetical protein ABEB36_008534 [Hypothenemus hampei]|uniref:SAM-dependent MTase RsmB/NOP-type domain-containing protein n=1 Tax=Hypothenemus hampei TaxID=57062 RepID=A0ABD1EMT6_HYPHA
MIRKPRYVRVNTIKILINEALNLFQEEGWILSPSIHKTYREFLENVKNLDGDYFLKDFHIPDLLVFPSGTEFYNHPGYRKGAIFLQDKASCLPVHILAPTPGSTVLDMCAAPGMKTTQLATKMENTGKIYAVEQDKGRFETLKIKVESSGATCVQLINKDVLECNNTDFPDVEYIIVDPSCSGSGMFDRLNEHDNKNASRLQKLAGFQIKILRSALTRYPSVKRVVYSTCSLYPEENENVVRQVLETNYDFKLVPAVDLLGNEWLNFGSSEFGNIGKYCLYSKPAEDLASGFFLAVFERLKEGEENEFCNKNIFRFQKNIRHKKNCTDKEKKLFASDGHFETNINNKENHHKEEYNKPEMINTVGQVHANKTPEMKDKFENVEQQISEGTRCGPQYMTDYDLNEKHSQEFKNSSESERKNKKTKYSKPGDNETFFNEEQCHQDNERDSLSNKIKKKKRDNDEEKVKKNREMNTESSFNKAVEIEKYRKSREQYDTEFKIRQVGYKPQMNDDNANKKSNKLKKYEILENVEKDRNEIEESNSKKTKKETDEGNLKKKGEGNTESSFSTVVEIKKVKKSHNQYDFESKIIQVDCELEGNQDKDCEKSKKKRRKNEIKSNTEEELNKTDENVCKKKKKKKREDSEKYVMKDEDINTEFSVIESVEIKKAERKHEESDIVHKIKRVDNEPQVIDFKNSEKKKKKKLKMNENDKKGVNTIEDNLKYETIDVDEIKIRKKNKQRYEQVEHNMECENTQTDEVSVNSTINESEDYNKKLKKNKRKLSGKETETVNRIEDKMKKDKEIEQDKNKFETKIKQVDCEETYIDNSDENKIKKSKKKKRKNSQTVVEEVTELNAELLDNTDQRAEKLKCKK